MLAIVAIWAFAEATVFVIVADLPISAIGALRGTRAALLAALIASLAAMLGGQAVLLGCADRLADCRAVMTQLPGIDAALADGAAAAYGAAGWPAVLRGSFSGTPYKLYALAAAGHAAPPLAFALVSVVARLPRFALVAILSGTIGGMARRRLSRRALIALLAGFWLIFYAVYFAAMP